MPASVSSAASLIAGVAAATATEGEDMPFWQRLLITVAAMLVTSFVASILWRWLFDADIPGYLSGVVGGATALPVWEILKRMNVR